MDCKEDLDCVGEVLDCDFFWPERRRARIQREAEEQRLRALGLTADAGPPP